MNTIQIRDVCLIQRAKFADRSEWKKGIDSILEFAYMGSSEFEWNALPSALNTLRELQSNYTYMDVPMRGKVVTVYCHNDHKSLIKGILENLADGKYRLQEYSDFDNYMAAAPMMPCRHDFWWDIDNNFMFWKKDVEFEKKFKSVI